MNELYIWHHMGMGDYFTCNGIVRHYAEKYDKIVLFFKHPTKENVKRLYHDQPNISFIDGGVYEDNLAKLWEMTHPGTPLVKAIMNRFPNDGRTFDQVFYDLANVPFDYKWSKFHFARDNKREKEVYYDVLGLKDGEEYLFVHDDYRGEVETKGLLDDIKIIRPHDYLDVVIYDFLLTIEKSKEVHMMNSGFLPLVDCIQLKHDNLNYHEYLRPGTIYQTRLNWKIIK